MQAIRRIFGQAEIVSEVKDLPRCNRKT